MRRILVLILFACCFCRAAFVSIDLKDSRLQIDNVVYKPGGIFGFALEFGVFNEPKNRVDYSLAVGFGRFGYSHSDGDKSVSAMDIYIKPLVWSITVKGVLFEMNVGMGYILSTKNFNPELEDAMENGFENWNWFDRARRKMSFRYGYRLGYRINDQLQVSLVANYQTLGCAWYGSSMSNRTMLTGGWGLNFQWNIPWIPF